MDTNRCRVLTKHLLKALPGFFDKLEMASCTVEDVCISFQPNVYEEKFVSHTCKAEDLLSDYDTVLEKALLPSVDRIYATIPIVRNGVSDNIVIYIEDGRVEPDVNMYTENQTELFISPADLNRKLKCRFLGGAPTELICYEGHISYIAECIHPKCLEKQAAVKDLRG